MTYQNSQEFLEHIQRSRRNPFPPGKRNEEFDDMTRRDLATVGLEFEPGPPTVDRLSKLISGLCGDIISAQPEHVRAQLTGKVAAGVLETGIANAFIVRGSNHCHAIVLNLGLMVLLNKAIKLWVGGAVKDGIAWCDVEDASTVDASQVHDLLAALFKSYAESGVPRGPMVKLNPQCLGKYSMALHLAEAFVVCHELGHYFNGDLTGSSDLHEMPDMPGALYYAGDSNIDKEHNADVTGFGMLSNYVGTNFPAIDEDFQMFALTCTMDVLGAISDGPGATHPDPRDRVIHVANCYLNPEKAEWWRRSYDTSR